MPNKIVGKSAEIQSLYKRFMSYNILEPFHVVFVHGVFKARSVEIYISSSVVKDMLTNEQLDISCMVCYQMMLHTLLLSSRGVNKCAFINPQNITSRLCQIDVTRHLVDVMRFHQDKEFFLAPYLQGEHWMLIVICPHHCTSYILDSIKSSKSLEYYIVAKHVEEAVGIFNTKSEKSHSESEKSCSLVMKWTFPKCNQQESYWECGYYVLNWMHEFVLFRQHAFPKNMWKDTRPFSSEELDARIFPWMKSFGSKYLK